MMQKYENIAIKGERIKAIQKMILREYSKEEILKLDYTENEYVEAKNLLSVNV